MYQLYTAAGACSMAIHAILNEMNVPFETTMVSIQNGDTQKPEYLKLNPRGQVPLLVKDGKVLLEGGAMITYLLDEHGDGTLLPKSGWERAVALQWLMYGNSSLHPAYARIFWLNRNVADEKTKTELMAIAMSNVQTMWDQIEQHLQAQPFLAGASVTAGDILLTVIANWGGFLPKQFTFGPKTKALLRAVAARPAFMKTTADEGVEYKAAA